MRANGGEPLYDDGRIACYENGLVIRHYVLLKGMFPFSATKSVLSLGVGTIAASGLVRAMSD